MRHLIFTLLLTLPLSAFEFTGKVVGVTDGDTLTVLYNGNQQYKVRLLHIDCPESGQAFGTKAKTALSTKVFGKTVTIKWTEMDRYKRILGDVHLGKRWINHELVTEGLAWHYKQYSKDASMAAAEVKARTAKVNIWSEPNPIAPWDFRRGDASSTRAPPTPRPTTPPVTVPAPRPTTPQPVGNTVFVTATGKKYHTNGCRYLAKSRVARTLALAKQQGYTPCSRCGAKFVR